MIIYKAIKILEGECPYTIVDSDNKNYGSCSHFDTLLESLTYNIYKKHKLNNTPFVIEIDCKNDRGVLVKESLVISKIELNKLIYFEAMVKKLLRENKSERINALTDNINTEFIKSFEKLDDKITSKKVINYNVEIIPEDKRFIYAGDVLTKTPCRLMDRGTLIEQFTDFKVMCLYLKKLYKENKELNQPFSLSIDCLNDSKQIVNKLINISVTQFESDSFIDSIDYLILTNKSIEDKEVLAIKQNDYIDTLKSFDNPTIENNSEETVSENNVKLHYGITEDCRYGNCEFTLEVFNTEQNKYHELLISQEFKDVTRHFIELFKETHTDKEIILELKCGRKTLDRIIKYPEHSYNGFIYEVEKLNYGGKPILTEPLSIKDLSCETSLKVNPCKVEKLIITATQDIDKTILINDTLSDKTTVVKDLKHLEKYFAQLCYNTDEPNHKYVRDNKFEITLNIKSYFDKEINTCLTGDACNYKDVLNYLDDLSQKYSSKHMNLETSDSLNSDIKIYNVHIGNYRNCTLHLERTLIYEGSQFDYINDFQFLVKEIIKEVVENYYFRKTTLLNFNYFIADILPYKQFKLEIVPTDKQPDLDALKQQIFNIKEEAEVLKTELSLSTSEYLKVYKVLETLKQTNQNQTYSKFIDKIDNVFKSLSSFTIYK